MGKWRPAAEGRGLDHDFVLYFCTMFVYYARLRQLPVITSVFLHAALFAERVISIPEFMAFLKANSARFVNNDTNGEKKS